MSSWDDKAGRFRLSNVFPISSERKKRCPKHCFFILQLHNSLQQSGILKSLSLQKWQFQLEMWELFKITPERKTAPFSLELRKYNSVSPLSEIYLAGSSQIAEIKDRYTFFWSCKKEQELPPLWYRLCHWNRHVKSLYSLQNGVSHRIMTTLLLLLWAVTSQPCLSLNRKKDESYEHLRVAISSIHSNVTLTPRLVF